MGLDNTMKENGKGEKVQKGYGAKQGSNPRLNVFGRASSKMAKDNGHPRCAGNGTVEALTTRR